MFEPISLSLIAQSLATSQVVSSVIGGWLGNRSDHYLCKAYQIVFDRLKNQSEPVNHDIQRAVREAYLNATLVTCQRLLKRKYTVVDRIFHFDVWDLKYVVGYLRKQLRQLPKANFVPPENPAAHDPTLLLQPHNVPAQERIAELKQQLRQQVVRELESTGYLVEDDLKMALLHGWTEDGKTLDWYDLLCAYFAESLKTNERLRTIVQTEILVSVQQGVQEVNVSMADFQRQTERFGETMQAFLPVAAEFLALLDRIEAKLDRVQETVETGNAYSRKMLPQILDGVNKLQPTSPARAKYLNGFVRYDFARLIGRVGEVAEMDDRLARQKILLLRGMGGIGKTTLAKAYLDRCHDAYDHLAYVDIVGSIADSMLNQLGNSSGLEFTANPQHTPDEKFTALIDTLRRIPNLLLVLDNIKDASDAGDLRNRKAALESLDATILITGRVRSAEFVQAGQLMEIGALSPEEALLLFERFLERRVKPNETELVSDILRKAFYHAKLIEVIATQIRRNLLLSLAEARAIVARRQYDDDEINYPDGIDEQAKTIYRILLDLFNTDPLPDDLKQLLRYFAVLPTIDIPIEHLSTLLGVAAPADRKTLTINLQKLAGTAWIDNLDNTHFSMHGLVQWVVREQLQPTVENCELLISGTVKLVYSLNKTNPLDAQPYVIYGDELLEIFKENQNELLTVLYSNLAITYRALGDYDKALEYNLKALGIREQTLSPTHPDLAVSYGNIAETYRALGDYDKALEYNLKALEIREHTLSPTHADLATSYNNIALAYGALGDHQQALAYNQKVLAIWENVLPSNHPYLGQAYSNIALSCGELNNHEQALIYNLKALSLREAVLPWNHPDLAGSYNNIAGVYRDLGNYKQAFAYNKKAIAIWEAVLPANHPTLAYGYVNIAATYSALGAYQEALIYNLKALSLREAVLPYNHLSIAVSYNNVAITYRDLGNYKQYLAYHLKAMLISESALPQDHPDLALCYYSVGKAYYYIEDLEKALVYVQKATTIQERILTLNHPDLLNSREGLAVIEQTIREQNDKAG